jgi:hypothetical protein
MAKKPAKTKPAKKQAPVAKKKAAKPTAVKSKKTTTIASKAKSAKPARKPVAKASVKVKAKPSAKGKIKPVTKVKPVVKTKPAVKAKTSAEKKSAAKVVAKAKPVIKVKPAKKTVVTSKPAAPKVAAKKKPEAKPTKIKDTPKKTVVVSTQKSTQTKPAKKVEPVKATKPAKKVEPVKATKPVIKNEPIAKESPKPAVKPAVEKNEVVATLAPKPEVKKEAVKTVEQQLAEKQDGAAISEKVGKSKEELFVPKYQLPTPVETVRPMRPKPPAILEDAPQKPVANPIYVPPAPDGKPGIKFAPMAIVEKPKEKQNKSEEEDMSSKTSPRLAFTESDDKKGVSVEAKLRALYGIQLIDSRIDKIHAMRGELPLEVQDLEDDVAGFEQRIKNLNDDIKNLNDEIVGKKNGIKNSEALIKKYKEQLDNVKNNREFDSLNKEIEYQELEIQLHNKKIREFEMALNAKKDVLAAAAVKLQERTIDLNLKRAELNDIIGSTEKEEKLLRKKSDEAKKLIEDRLLSAYERIRSGAPNGMAVVPIEREASAGSFIQLPPQKQLDVAARKRVIVDEHSGRILVDSDLAREEQEKMENLLTNELK